MRMFTLLSVFLTFGVLGGVRAHGEGELSDAAAVLSKAQAAAKQADIVRYTVQYLPSGWLTSRVPRIEGTVIVGDQSKWKLDRFRCDIKIRKPDSEETVELTAGCDGEVYFLIDPRTKTAHEDMDPTVMGSNSRNVQRVVLSALGAAEPYSDEIKAEKKELREAVKIGEVECHQVYAKLTEREVLWFFSKTDFLPRRLERVATNPAGEVATVQLTVTGLVVNPKPSSNPFKLVVPEGYKKTDQFAD